MKSDESSRVWADETGIWREDRPGAAFGTRWEEIVTLGAYRPDCITETNVILTFDFELGEYVEIGDYSAGFSEVVLAVASHLGIPDLIKTLEVLTTSEILTLWTRSDPWNT